MEKKLVVTYRYSWKMKDSKKVCFKIVSDLDEGHDAFVKSCIENFGDNLEGFTREYVNSYEVCKVGMFEDLLSAKKEEVVNKKEEI